VPSTVNGLHTGDKVKFQSESPSSSRSLMKRMVLLGTDKPNGLVVVVLGYRGMDDPKLPAVYIDDDEGGADDVLRACCMSILWRAWGVMVLGDGTRFRRGGAGAGDGVAKA
jgi:hypothetical protein